MPSAGRCGRSGVWTRRRGSSRSRSPGPTEAGVDTPYFYEELAECYAATGQPDAARAQARRALELLNEDAESSERVERLRGLAA